MASAPVARAICQSEAGACAPEQSQCELPGLAHQIATELAVALACDQLEASVLVDAARGGKNAVGPERDLAVARGAGEADALVDEASANAEATRLGIDEQEAEPGNACAVLHQEHAAYRLAAALRHETAFAPTVELAQELGDDLGGERLDILVPAVLAAIDRAVAGDDP